MGGTSTAPVNSVIWCFIAMSIGDPDPRGDHDFEIIEDDEDNEQTKVKDHTTGEELYAKYPAQKKVKEAMEPGNCTGKKVGLFSHPLGKKCPSKSIKSYDADDRWILLGPSTIKYCLP